MVEQSGASWTSRLGYTWTGMETRGRRSCHSQQYSNISFPHMNQIVLEIKLKNNNKKTSPRVLGSCDELLSLLELIATRNFKLQSLTVCFRLDAQTLGSSVEFYFKLKVQTSTSNFNI